MFVPGHRLTPHRRGPRLAPLAREAEMGESFVTRGSLGNEASAIACNLSALSPDQRAQLGEVQSQLRSMVREVRDLPDGYAFLLSAPEGSLVRVAEFIELERRCCPFFKFELEVQEEGGVAWLRLKGRAGVKQFIAAELGLEKLGNEGAFRPCTA